MNATVITSPNRSDLRAMCMAVKWVYKNMIIRCSNPSSDNYKYYGGKGIKVCARWLESIATFATDMGPRPADCTLDRINNDGDYEPGNCRWATKEIQSRNRSGLAIVSLFGETKCATAWADDSRCKVSKDTLLHRLRAGWDHRLAICREARAPAQHMSCCDVDFAYRLPKGTTARAWRAKEIPGKKRGKAIYVSAKRAEELYGVGA